MASDGLRITAPFGVDRSARRRRAAKGGLALTTALVLLPLLLLVLFDTDTPLVAWLFAPLTGLVSLGALVQADKARKHLALAPGAVSIEGGALVLEGATRARVPLSDVVEGWWEDPGRAHFRLRSGDEFVVEPASEAEGARLLEAAGVSAARRVLRVPLVSAASQLPFGRAIGVATLVVLGPLLAFWLLVVAAGVREVLANAEALGIAVVCILAMLQAVVTFLAYLVVAWLSPREVAIGTDGVVVRRTIGREAIRYASVRRFVPVPHGVRIELQNGRVEHLPTLTREEQLRADASGAGTARRQLILDRVEQAMHAGGEGALALATLERLDRQGRSIEAWRRDLATLLDAPPGYRTPALSADELAAVVEDAAAPPARRIAATIALAAKEPTLAAERVRIAVDATANDALRRALERAAEGEIDELAVDAPTPPRRMTA